MPSINRSIEFTKLYWIASSGLFVRRTPDAARRSLFRRFARVIGLGVVATRWRYSGSSDCETPRVGVRRSQGNGSLWRCGWYDGMFALGVSFEPRDGWVWFQRFWNIENISQFADRRGHKRHPA